MEFLATVEIVESLPVIYITHKDWGCIIRHLLYFCNTYLFENTQNALMVVLKAQG